MGNACGSTPQCVIITKHNQGSATKKLNNNNNNINNIGRRNLNVEKYLKTVIYTIRLTLGKRKVMICDVCKFPWYKNSKNYKTSSVSC